MNDEHASGNRWEPTAAPSAAPITPAPGAPGTATAVQDPPVVPAATWAPPPVPERRGLKDRWRGAPPAARTGAVGLVGLLLLLGVGLGGFALGRGTAPDGGTTPTTPDGRLGDRPDLDGDGGLGRGPRGFGGPDQGIAPDGTLPDGTLPDGTDDGTGTDSGATGTLSWYVVPHPSGTTGTTGTATSTGSSAA